MDRFCVVLSPAAEDLRKIPPRDRLKILKQTARLMENPFPHGTRKKRLKGKRAVFYRLRVGDWRAVYRIEKTSIVILMVINRRDLEGILKDLT